MSACFESLRGMTFPFHGDHMGHVNNRWYAHFFDDASLALWSQVGLSERKLADEHGTSAVIARIAIDFHHELHVGEQFVVKSAFTRLGTKSVTFVSRLYNADTEALCATQTVVGVFFDIAARESRPMPASVRTIVAPLCVSSDEGPVGNGA